MQNKIVLDVKNLSVSIDDQIILKNLSFEIKEHEVLIILGPNGAGKTTLFRTLLGFIPHTGQIKWNAKKISYLPPQEFLNRKGLPSLSIQDFFHFKTKNQKDITSMLDKVGLSKNILYKQFGALSTGQFQRMAIAWALISNPDVLLFDEATSGIDIGGNQTIYSLLHKFWQETNLTILLVTHDLNIVWEHANQVLCLNKECICKGNPHKILTTENLQKLYETDIKFYKHSHN